MIEINPTILLIQIAVFLIGMGLVWKFFLSPFNRKLEERKKTIADNYANAEQIRSDAQKIYKEYEARLLDLENKTGEMFSKTEKQAEESRQEIVRQAHEQARVLLKRTEQELASEKQVLISELRDEIGSLGVLMAEKILQRKFARQEHEKLLEEVAGELSK